MFKLILRSPKRTNFSVAHKRTKWKVFIISWAYIHFRMESRNVHWFLGFIYSHTGSSPVMTWSLLPGSN